MPLVFLNLFMALWERMIFFSKNEPRLLFWQRYIDDAFILWRGEEESFYMFMAGINNRWGIRLKTSINFLDLVIFLRKEDVCALKHSLRAQTGMATSPLTVVTTPTG